MCEHVFVCVPASKLTTSFSASNSTVKQFTKIGEISRITGSISVRVHYLVSTICITQQRGWQEELVLKPAGRDYYG